MEVAANQSFASVSQTVERYNIILAGAYSDIEATTLLDNSSSLYSGGKKSERSPAR